MNIKVYLDQRDGQVWDISPLTVSFQWKTKRIGAASSIDISVASATIGADIRITPGNVIRIHVDQTRLFYGFVFEVEEGINSETKIKAYDQIRYLMISDSYAFQAVTATQMIRRLAKDYKLKTGNLDDTLYRLPPFVEENKKLLDMICTALDRTLIATGRNYVFYDDFGALRLRLTDSWKVDFTIGDASLLTDVTLKRSIDKDTYNRIKLLQKNKTSGGLDLYIAQDSSTIAKWGMLQFTETVDEKWNQAQIKQKLDQLIRLRNRESKSISVQSLGRLDVRAGCYVPIQVSDWNIHQYFLVDECTHQFGGGSHTMSLELKVI